MSSEASRPGGARGVLDGVRVVDFTQVLAGPYGTSLLGDFGADVIKVEPPGGEPFRAIDNLIAPGESGYYYGINRSKRAMTLDLKHPASRTIVERLVRQSDVVVVGFRPAAVARIGLDFESLSSINPQLVYCSLTAFGDTGPLAAEPTCQQVSVNLLDGQIAMLANFITPYFLTREPIRRAGGGHPQVVPYQVFEASDGCMVVACLNDTFWAPLCQGIDHAELISDPRFATNPARAANRGELIPFLERLFATATRDVWLSRLRSHGVPCAPVNELEEALTQPQVVHNEALTELKHPIHGSYTVPSNPIKMSGSPPRPHGYVPGVGEHTSEVLAELGFDQREIREFEAAGVV